MLATLSELRLMAAVGPVSLREVWLVLERRLLELALPAEKSRYGKVTVAPCEAARGLAFDVVCVPGLAEKLFPKHINEDPILLDEQRAALDLGLATNRDRRDRERLALRLAVGAARTELFLSYPRLDLEKSRPRVPSFYGLEALGAAEGRIVGFDEFEARAERATDVRVGWPAPKTPAEAIDDAEYDVALLEQLMQPGSDEGKGAARYLLKELGLTLMMAAIGLNAGGGLVEGLTAVGPTILLSALCVGLVRIMVGYGAGRRLLKLNPALLLGSLTGAVTGTPALGVVTATARSSVPAIGYAGTYTFANVLLTFAGTTLMTL